MSKTTVVTEYTGESTPTLTLDDRIQREIERNGITRPTGYTVSWHANPEVEKHHFGPWHPMNPWRLTMTKEIVLAYGMHTAMDTYLSRSATREELVEFHKEDYIDFLSRVTPENMSLPPQSNEFTSFNMGDDCPIFDGIFEYCSLYAGASLDAARKLINHQSDIAINWSGGLHHAKKSEASGFCYVNDIVLAVLQLLRHHPRVLYVDIDVHHGDGVEGAFWSTDRVLTVSFHKYDREQFFPGTGPLDSTGPPNPLNPGAHHAINVPLNDGIDDESYIWLFKSIIGPCIETYKPTAICLQCGADSLGNDRLGCFNLNVPAHGSCLSFVKSYGIPLLVVGGGGYTPRNVARAWAHETSLCIEAADRIDPILPLHMPFRSHFEGETLFPPLHGKYENKNPRAYLENIIRFVREQLRYMQGAPSVQMQHIPPDILGWREEIDKQMEEERYEASQDDDTAMTDVVMSTTEMAGSSDGLALPPGKGRKDLEKGAGEKGGLALV